jgi:hypothetical protein
VYPKHRPPHPVAGSLLLVLLAVIVLSSHASAQQPRWDEERATLCEYQLVFPRDCDKEDFRVDQGGSFFPVNVGTSFTSNAGFHFESLAGLNLELYFWFYDPYNTYCPERCRSAYPLAVAGNIDEPLLMTLPNERELVSLVYHGQLGSLGFIAYDSSWSVVDRLVVKGGDASSPYLERAVVLGDGQSLIKYVAIFTLEFEPDQFVCNPTIGINAYITDIQACSP